MDAKRVAEPLLNRKAARDLFCFVKSGSISQKSLLKAFKVEAPGSVMAEALYRTRTKKTCPRWAQSQTETFLINPSTSSGASSLTDVDVVCSGLDRIERKLRRRGIPRKKWTENKEYRTRSWKAEVGLMLFQELRA